jgi:hypothetical protein
MPGQAITAPTPEQGPERVLIVKGHHARLASQSEQFANELTRHLGICAPACRILRRVVGESLSSFFAGSRILIET